MRSITLVCLLLFCGMANAQNQQVPSFLNLKPGEYQSTELINILEKEGLHINYASQALKNKSIVISKQPISTMEVLNLLFDAEKYNFQIKGDKVLVVPKNHRRLQTYSGFIEEEISRERLVGVNLYIADLQLGTTTNAFGYYSLSVPAEDSLQLSVSLMGYEPRQLSLHPGLGAALDLALQPQSEVLPEVLVTDEAQPLEEAQMSVLKMSPIQIQHVPAVFGEADIMRSLQLLPGVQASSEGSASLYIRGGSPDQNLILLDGVPVYNASHLLGFFSIFNTDAIKGVSLTKGGFPARYGGRLSSVINIDMKEGNLQEYQGNLSLGVISGKLSLEGPIQKDKSSFILSARRTWIDLFLQSLFDNNNFPGYYFGDFNLKVNHSFSRKDRIYISTYAGRDKLSMGFQSGPNTESEVYLKWGNVTTALRYNHIYSDQLFGNLTATFSNYRLILGSHTEKVDGKEGSAFFSQIRDYGLRYDWEYQPLSNHKLRYGSSYTFHLFNPAAVRDFVPGGKDDISYISPNVPAHDIFIYGEDDWTISSRWLLNLGLHYSQYWADRTFYHNLQPRLSGRYRMSNNMSLKLSYAEMAQYIHLLTNSGLGMPTDLWVSSNRFIAPQLSRQAAVGHVWQINRLHLEVETELYHKWMNDLIAYSDGGYYLNNANWESAVLNNGRGWSYGGEILFKYQTEYVDGWLGYTLAWSKRQFAEINDGEIFPYRYDRRHDLSLMTHITFTPRFDMGLNWIYATGQPFTAPESTYLLPSPYGGLDTYTQYGRRNAERMPDTHRLDLSFNFHKERSWGMRTWSFSFYNVYNHKNPYILFVKHQGDGQSDLKQISLLGFLPAISYSIKF